MLELKTKKQLGQEAHTFAVGHKLVRYRNTTYIPADYETRLSDPAPDDERKIWIPLSRVDIQQHAALNFDTLFSSDSELSSFDFMVAQNSQRIDTPATTLLIRTAKGLQELQPDGKLHDPSQAFVPNTVNPMLNEKKKDIAEVFRVISEWVDSEEEAHSLLHHLATSLAPGWSAVKYVLLIGEGRNGKSLLMKMVQALFGRDNVSTVTRQQISEQNPVVTELNGKLVNIVYDGRAEYLKDSASEKSLVAGEPIPIRKLYESTPTMVQTNALFIEGLNKEPKSNDKSTALQKRLVRFEFPNVYDLDHSFERKMLGEDMLGAFLALLMQHYVQEDEVAEKLKLSPKAMQLQLEHMYINSVALQFLQHLEETDPLGAVGILGTPLPEMVKTFQSWRVKENDLGTWAEPDVIALFNPLINSERKSMRVNSMPRKVRVATSFKPEALAFLDSLKGDSDDSNTVAVVED